MDDVRIIPTEDALCGSHARQLYFQLFASQKCMLFQISQKASANRCFSTS